MGCSHTRTEIVESEWEDWDGEIQYEQERVEISTCVDIDLHRYKCAMCGEIGYYSGAARAYHKDGVKSNIKGLDV